MIVFKPFFQNLKNRVYKYFTTDPQQHVQKSQGNYTTRRMFISTILLLLSFTYILCISVYFLKPQLMGTMYAYAFPVMLIAFSVCFLVIIGARFNSQYFGIDPPGNVLLDPGEGTKPVSEIRSIRKEVECNEDEVPHTEKTVQDGDEPKSSVNGKDVPVADDAMKQIKGTIRDGYLFYGRQSLSERNYSRAFYDYYNAYRIGPSPLTYFGMIASLVNLPGKDAELRLYQFFDEMTHKMKDPNWERDNGRNTQIIDMFALAQQQRGKEGFLNELKRLVDTLL